MLRKIADLPLPCHHPEHNPPSHIVLPSGVYAYTCPGCGRGMQFNVMDVRWATNQGQVLRVVQGNSLQNYKTVGSNPTLPSTNADWLWNKFITTSLTPFVGSDASGFVPAESNPSLTQ